MAYSLEQILGYVSLGKTIEKQRRGVPDVLPPEFKKVTDKAIKDRHRIYRTYGERRTARLTNYGQAARKNELKKLEQYDVILVHSFEEIGLDPHVLGNLQSTEAYVQDTAMKEAGRQVQEFAQKFENLRTVTALHALRLGNLYFDSEGELLPSSSGATFTITYNRSANNESQLNGIIDASWALATTNIPLHARQIKKRSLRDTGIRQNHGFYGENIVTYFEQNNFVQEELARDDSGMRTEYLNTGEMPNGLFGLQWSPCYEAFFEDYDGSNQDVWDADAVVFTPKVGDGDWWGMAEGSFFVPKTIDVAGQGEAALQNMEQVWGMFGYGLVIHNPVTVKVYMGDTMLPLLRNAEATYSADTTP